MTLFAALGDKGTPTTTTSTCSPPTAIQLHSHHAINFIDNKITRTDQTTFENASKKSHRHSLMSYQAIQTQQDEEEVRSHNKPDLGVWNCRTDNEFDDASLGSVVKSVVLQIGGKTNEEEEKESNADTGDNAATTVVMTVHLKELNEVQPTLERMRNVVVSAYGGEDGLGRVNGKRGTTSIKTLQSCVFGSAHVKQEVDPTNKSGGSIALILAAIVPSSTAQENASTEYQERQKQSLVVYHLHKFALEVNCTLCFVREGGVDGINAERDTNNSPASMKIEELAVVIQRVAMGLAPLDDKTSTFGESSAENDPETSTENQQPTSSDTPPNPSVYPPGSHDSELICGAMQRNASCEGLWDASKDDLHVALPPLASTSSTASNTKQESKGGDEEWLSKLASSVGITIDATSNNSNNATNGEKEALTPVERKRETMRKKKSSKSTMASSTSEKAPSDFFANLLKK